MIFSGRPFNRFRPLISMDSSPSSKGQAEPIWILISSAVRSPISRLYFFLMKLMMEESNSSPPTRTDLEATMPPKEITATSLVPPPMSTTMEP